MPSPVMLARVAPHPTPKLREMATLLVGNPDPAADDVLGAVLEVLEKRMPEAEFIAFCDGLGKAGSAR